MIRILADESASI